MVERIVREPGLGMLNPSEMDIQDGIIFPCLSMLIEVKTVLAFPKFFGLILVAL